jgi:hypothetical protein
MSYTEYAPSILSSPTTTNGSYLYVFVSLCTNSSYIPIQTEGPWIVAFDNFLTSEEVDFLVVRIPLLLNLLATFGPILNVLCFVLFNFSLCKNYKGHDFKLSGEAGDINPKTGKRAVTFNNNSRSSGTRHTSLHATY